MSDRPGGSTDPMADDDELELVDPSQLAEERKRALVAKLPDKEGSQLKKEEIQLIIRTEKLVGRNFLFAVSRAGSSSPRYHRLHYNVRGDQASAKATAPCKYIRCSDCAELLYFEGSHLSRHEASHKRLQDDRKRPATSQITDFIPHPLSETEKSAVTDVLASYAIEGNVSFRSITQPAFTRAAIALINIGAKRRKPVEEKPDQLVDRTTVARRVTHIAEESYDKIKGILDIMRESGGALAADYGKRLDDYLCVTAHFIQPGASGWRLRCVPVGFSVCSESKTSEQVWLDMIDALDPFGMSEDDISKCIGVSDEGANISGSLRDHMDSAVLCACHVFSTIANRSFDLYAFVKDRHLLTAQEEKLVSKALDVIHLARLIANEVVRELSIRPNKGVDTRWLSSHDIACDVQKILQELVELKRDREFSCRMGQALSGAIMKLNGLRNELNDCVEFLSIFKKPLERLQSESQPTVHLVWDATLKLLHKATKFANNQEKSLLLQALGKSCQIAIQHRLDNGFITDTHRIGAFLDARMRHMSHLTDEQRTELHDLVRSRIAAFPLTQRAPEQPLRHFIDDSDSDDEVIIRRADVPRNIDEVTNYIEDHFSETASPVFDPLNFWHAYEERYPKLSKLALRIFAVPASSASCERAFRRLKAIITENRQNLDPETVTKLMLSRSFINSDASFD